MPAPESPDYTPTQHMSTNDPQQQQQQSDDAWLESTFARHQVASYIFNEFRDKNFTNQQTDSAAGGSITEMSGLGPAPAANDVVLFAPAAGSSTGVNGHLNGTLGQVNGAAVAVAAAAAAASGQARPYFGDAFQSFQTVYWPIHCVICLVICSLGIFANVTNIIVLTRPNMITAVNTILSAMAFSDLVVNISTIPYLIHELSDSTNLTSFHSFQWAVYILIHAHTSVTAHTISIWLTCVLATWRYFVVCRSQSSNQRNWSVGLAKRTIVGVFLFVPCFCIPNYLSFAIIKDATESNGTIYRVGFSHLADESQFIKTFHFWIFSCLTKLLPCVLLTFFTTVLIRKLLKARERRLRLTTYGNKKQTKTDETTTVLIPNGFSKSNEKSNNKQKFNDSISNGNVNRQQENVMLFKELNSNCLNKQSSDSCHNESVVIDESMPIVLESNNSKTDYNSVRLTKETDKGSQSAEATRSSYQTREADSLPVSCSNSGSSVNLRENNCNVNSNATFNDSELETNRKKSNQSLVLSQLIVESFTNATQTKTVSTSTKLQTSTNCDNQSNMAAYIRAPVSTNNNQKCANNDQSPRCASTCGAMDSYVTKRENNSSAAIDTNKQPLVLSSMTASQELPTKSNQLVTKFDRKSYGISVGDNCSSALNDSVCDLKLSEKRGSETTIYKGTRGRSIGSTTLAPLQIVKLHATQKQLSQNETTTRLLIAVMIVFLICEFPAGILAALCAVLGQDFWENVYQPTGSVTDLLALINSSVNFILYCFMSTQFRITFYRVVLHCPAPNVPQHHQAIITNVNQTNTNNTVNDEKQQQQQQSSRQNVKQISKLNY